MGFDVFGIRPENEQGIYFRNSIWWWPRLWDYCCFITPELLKEDHESGHVNDGYIIDGIKHKSLVRNLSAALKQRENYNDWIKNSEKIYLRNQQQSALLSRGEKARNDDNFNKCRCYFDWQNVDKFLLFAKSNQGFKIC